MTSYKAPWGASLLVISCLGTIVLVVATIATWHQSGLLTFIAIAAVATLIGAALFTVRSYELSPGMLSIRRLFWATRLPLAGLQAVQFKPNVMRRSIRLFGNGGLFSFTGIFRNRELGTYRAFVTDPNRTVILKFRDRTVVLSPSTPDEFVNEVHPQRVS